MSHYIIKARANRIAALEAIGAGRDNIFGELVRQPRGTLRLTRQRRLLRVVRPVPATGGATAA